MHEKVKLESMMAVWLFDKRQGNKAIDATKNGHDGKIEGGTKRVNGKFGKGLEFDGTTVIAR